MLIIKKLVLFLLFITFLLPAEEYLVTPTSRIITKLNVRDLPNGQIIGELHRGEYSELIEKIPFWYKVKLKSGKEGFVSKGYSKLVPLGSNSELKITYLHIGAGACAVVNCPASNKSILMDCGSWPGTVDSNFHHSEADISLKLKNIIGNNELSAVFSHGDIDHYNYVPFALANVQLKEIWLVGFSSFYTQKSFPKWLKDQQSGGSSYS
ncbi:SH3 domain-containing protein [Crocosphaera sp.]|uniref:SH3 domain-containing protein n=1 Tax=Crocosphaera sp. TaxID=2729996 RepID=UPI002579B14D|nr:SH3 domain-containing protein [Crocosphaera sp.]NQZ62558.1 SH3 domain-containing protein [Crocosphaera sp.]